MSLENVVKDIPLISDNTWTYGDLMVWILWEKTIPLTLSFHFWLQEVEARILKALQPKICLDPTPNLDRLCEKPVSSNVLN